MRTPGPSSRVRLQISLSLVALLFSTMAGADVGVWTTNGPPGGANTIITAPGSPGIVYAGGEGLFRSADNGSTWAATGITDQTARPLATSPPATIYASTVLPAPLLATSSLQVSLDSGTHWTVMRTGEFTVYGLAVDPFVPATLFLSAVIVGPNAFQASSMSRSVDGGATWTEIDSALGLSTAMISTIAIDPSISGTVYVATYPQIRFLGATHGIYKSSDSGTTWSFLPASGSMFRINALAIDPHTSSTIYAGGLDGGVIKSVDGGSTFSPMNSGLTGLVVVSLCIDPVRPNRLYAATVGGVFASVDGAVSWQPMNTGLTDLNVYSLAIDSTGSYLHAATASGVFDYQIPVSTCTSDTHTLCLNDGRFSVTADFQQTPEGPSAPATAIPLTNDTGYFWFFEPTNVEMVVKVLTGCPVNDEYWVFAGGLTNVGVEWKVTDAFTGTSKSYSNAAGTAFQPVQDSSAFPCQ